MRVIFQSKISDAGVEDWQLVVKQMEEDLRNFITQHLAKDRSALKDIHDPIFSSGVVDSFGIVQLVSYIYERYQVDIDPTAIDIEEMDTAARIAQLIRKRRGEAEADTLTGI